MNRGKLLWDDEQRLALLGLLLGNLDVWREAARNLSGADVAVTPPLPTAPIDLICETPSNR